MKGGNKHNPARRRALGVSLALGTVTAALPVSPAAAQRMRTLERGGDPFCPAIYKVWAQGRDGYAVAAEFDPSTL